MSTARRGGGKPEPHVSLVPLAPEVDQLRIVYDLAVAVGRAGALADIYDAALEACRPRCARTAPPSSSSTRTA